MPSYGDRDARGGPALRRSKNASCWTGFESDDRKALTYTVHVRLEGRRRSFVGRWTADPSVDVRVSSRFSASLDFNYSRNVDDDQFYGNYGDVGIDTTHYTFARLDQTTISLSSRLNFTATPNLSFQFYGQPYVSNGTYADWRELRSAALERLRPALEEVRHRVGDLRRLQLPRVPLERRDALRVPAGQHAVHRVAAGPQRLPRAQPTPATTTATTSAATTARPSGTTRATRSW